MYKLYLSIFVCVLLVQQNYANDDELGSSKDDVEKAFHKLMALIDKAFTEAQSALDKAMEKVESKATELEAQAVKEIDKVLDPLKAKLNDLITKAEAKGFDVTKCQSYVDHFTNTSNQFAINLIECINTQVVKAQGYIDDALKNIKTVEEDLNSIDSEIDNCEGNTLNKLKCYAKILEKIAKDTEKSPQHIVEDVAKATSLVTEVIPILEQCFTNQLEKAGEDALNDVKDFAICVVIPF